MQETVNTSGVEQDIKLPAFFDANPQLKARMVEYLKTISPDEKQKNLEQYFKFISGDITWAEIRGITKRMQREVARVGFMKFKMQDYAKAETIFKGLAIIDHTNWYYRAALGAVYQKLKRYDDAIAEYAIGLELKEGEISCLVNRGECHFMLQDLAAAKTDLQAAMALKLPVNNPWLIRAKLLSKRVEMMNEETTS